MFLSVLLLFLDQSHGWAHHFGRLSRPYFRDHIHRLSLEDNAEPALPSLNEYWDGERSGSSPPEPNLAALADRTLPPPKVLILPGFGNDELDYLQGPSDPAGNPRAGTSMVSTLKRRGFDVSVLRIRTRDWLQVFTRGFFDLDFWRGSATANSPSYAWYVDAARDAIRTLTDSEDDGTRVIVIGHSAGGWLARAAVAGSSHGSGNDDDLRAKVSAIVTLGSPHAPPPKEVFDATRGAVGDVMDRCSAGSLRAGGTELITVAGNGIVGDTSGGMPWDRASARSYATLVVGNGDGVRGDGVVPLDCAHLKDASAQVTLDCMHSVIVAGTALPSTTWYGSERAVDKWLEPTLDILVRGKEEKSQSA